METLEDRIAKYGKSVITNLYILVRITGIYDSMNEAILNTAKRLMADMELLLEDTGELVIKIIEGSFYIEGIRIKAMMSDIEGFTALAEELKKRLIGVLEFRAPLQAMDLVHLAYAVRGGAESAEVQSKLESKLTKGITVGGPVVLQKGEEIDLKDSRAVAKQAYLKGVALLKDIDRAVKSGKRFQLKKIKRALQLMVDCIMTDESYLLAFAAVRNYENYYFFHPVNVSILSITIGKKMGMDRVMLRTLAMAAFFHDLGKVEIPLALLNKKTELTAKEMDLIKRHPVDGIKVLMRSLGLNEASILSILVSFEHHIKLDSSGYPQSSGKRKLSLFSRIVSIADDFDSLVSGKVYSRNKFAPQKAIKMMLSESGSRYDPFLMKVFAQIFA